MQQRQEAGKMNREGELLDLTCPSVLEEDFYPDRRLDFDFQISPRPMPFELDPTTGSGNNRWCRRSAIQEVQDDNRGGHRTARINRLCPV